LHSAAFAALNGRKVLLIDCCNSVHIIRLRNILLHHIRTSNISSGDRSVIGATIEAALSLIHIQKAFDIFAALDRLSQANDSDDDSYQLVIVDSYHRLFAPYLPAVDKAGKIKLMASLYVSINC
jgi:cellulose biosynthesis protein BcsQ